MCRKTDPPTMLYEGLSIIRFWGLCPKGTKQCRDGTKQCRDVTKVNCYVFTRACAVTSWSLIVMSLSELGMWRHEVWLCFTRACDVTSWSFILMSLPELVLWRHEVYLSELELWRQQVDSYVFFQSLWRHSLSDINLETNTKMSWRLKAPPLSHICAHLTSATVTYQKSQLLDLHSWSTVNWLIYINKCIYAVTPAWCDNVCLSIFINTRNWANGLTWSAQLVEK